MRRCLIGDITTAAAVLAAVAAPHRAAMAMRLIHEAHAAHHYTKRLHRPHPLWGNGSLMARALACQPATPQPLDLAALAEILHALARFRAGPGDKNAAQPWSVAAHAPMLSSCQIGGPQHGRRKTQTVRD